VGQLIYTVYRYLISPIVFSLLPLLAFFHPKIKAGLQIRRKPSGLDSKKNKNLAASSGILFHVSSVGEYLQSRPVIDQIKRVSPHTPIYLSYFSPSLGDWLKDRPLPHADWVGPFLDDRVSNVRSLLTALNPACVVLCKFDLWPNLIIESYERKLPIFLISATLRAQSPRHRSYLGRRFYAYLYSKLTQIFAVSLKDAHRFREVLSDKSLVLVSGDTRVDSVLDRRDLEKNAPLPPLLERLQTDPRKKLVIGSSWPQDEAQVLEAQLIIKKMGRPSHTLTLWVPHEIGETHLAKLERAIGLQGRVCTRWTDWQKSKASLGTLDDLIVDQMGLLAGLYRIGDVAYIGAGPGGIHNVMEPAAWKLPVLFGPQYHNSPEAGELIEIGAAKSFTLASELAQTLAQLFDHPDQSSKMGAQGQSFLEAQKGATQSCVDSILVSLK
jgi:3-deoxy-D-manno-octulosonic-acid transferase